MSQKGFHRVLDDGDRIRPQGSRAPENSSTEFSQHRSTGPKVDEKWVSVPADVGDVQARNVKPVGARGTLLPTIRYMPGGGWVLENAGTHDRPVHELAVSANAAVVCVDYNPSPSSIRSRLRRPARRVAAL